MFNATARYYDKIYAFKNYEKEVEAIRDRLAREHGSVRTVLDVACGSGEHARLLARTFEVDGIDLEPDFIPIARAKTPAGTFSVADMRNFQLARRYDAVLCLFSSIGYLLNSDDIVAALRCFKAHLAPGGVLLVEPWIQPSKWRGPRPDMIVVDEPDLKICRMGISAREGDLTHLEFQYLIGTKAGVEHAREHHTLLLTEPEEMARHFQSAGLRCEYDPEGLTGRGLFVARTESSGEP